MGYNAVFDKKRRFGVELEFFGITSFELQYTLTEWGIPAKIELYENPHVPYWTIGSDGSIQGENAIELRSPVLCGAEGLSQVKRVLTLLNYLECQVNDSCGLHVHQFAEDFSGKDVLALLRFYSKFENVLDGLVDVSRREDKNIHCRSLLRDENLVWIESLDKTGKSRAIEITMRYNDLFRTRKDKVSILSYIKYVTIEFRHHESTLNIDEALSWIVLTQAIVSRVKSASVSRELSSNPVLSEMQRILGFSNSQDNLILECREWMQNKYSNVRKKKTVISKVLA